MKKVNLVLLMVACLLVAMQVSAEVLEVSNFPEIVLIDGHTAETKIANQEAEAYQAGSIQSEAAVLESVAYLISIMLTLAVLATVILMKRKIEEGFLQFAEFT